MDADILKVPEFKPVRSGRMPDMKKAPRDNPRGFLCGGITI